MKQHRTAPRILVVDVGGNNVKVAMARQRQPVKIPSGPTMTARQMASAVLDAVSQWTFDRVSIGIPTAVRHCRPSAEPPNLGGGWKRFDYARAFGKPVRIINDAAMQALGSYEGGRMLFLGLGTGLGSALVVNNVLVPLELGHLPYRKERTYEDYLGRNGLERMGDAKWTEHVHLVVALLREALQADEVVLGGGEAKNLLTFPADVRLGSNQNAIRGGLRLWDERHYPAARRTRKHGRS
jgi:polyphosphate glucokinase